MRQVSKSFDPKHPPSGVPANASRWVNREPETVTPAKGGIGRGFYSFFYCATRYWTTRTGTGRDVRYAKLQLRGTMRYGASGRATF